MCTSQEASRVLGKLLTSGFGQSKENAEQPQKKHVQKKQKNLADE
jgi:hypothetical protein